MRGKQRRSCYRGKGGVVGKQRALKILLALEMERLSTSKKCRECSSRQWKIKGKDTPLQQPKDTYAFTLAH